MIMAVPSVPLRMAVQRSFMGGTTLAIVEWVFGAVDWVS